MSKKQRRLEQARQRSASCPQVAQRWRELIEALEQAQTASFALAEAIAGLTPEQAAMFVGKVSNVARDARHTAWVVGHMQGIFEAELPFEAKHELPAEAAA